MRLDTNKKMNSATGSALILLCVVTIAYAQSEDNNNCASDFPFYHGKTGDNFPLAGISSTAEPKFSLLIKQKKDLVSGMSIYKHKKTFKVVAVANTKDVRIKQMFITAFKVKGDSEAKCNMGKFKASTKAKKATVLAADCETVLNFDSTKKKGSKKVKGKWIAPKSNGCDIIMRLTIVGSDNKIYEDEIDDEEIYDEDVLAENKLTLLLTSKQVESK